MRILAALIAVCVAGVAFARPVVVKESAQIRYPTIPGYSLAGPTAVDGDDAIVLGYRSEDDPNGYTNTFNGVFLFHRSGANWNYVRKLAEGVDSGADDTNGHVAIAMKDGIAALAILPLFIFERQPNGDWTQSQHTIQYGSDPADDIEIDNGRIFWGAGSWGGVVIARNPAGVWEQSQRLFGDNNGDSDNSHGGPVDFSGRWAGILNPYNADDLPAPSITTYINFSGAPAAWQLNQRLLPDAGHTLGDFAIRGEDLFVDDSPLGLAYYNADDNRQWYRRDQLRTAGDYMGGLDYRNPGEVKKGDNYILHRVWDYDRDAAVVHVFQGDVYLGYVHTATLIDSRGSSLGAVQISGRRVIASAVGRTLIFDLPATFAPKSIFQEPFETGNGGGWTQLAGSQWSVAQSGDTRVFRQSSTVGDAGASFDATNWANQSIQADIKPTAFNGADRWFGLATRRSDAANYYYVTLRSSGIVALKRNKNGAFANIASASFPVTLNRTYRVRLESFGIRHRVFIDGVLALDATDDSLIAGHPALLTSRAAADFDNVIVSPSWTHTLYAANTAINYDPPIPNPAPWTYSGAGQWSWVPETGNDLVFRQSSTTGDARAAIDPGINQVLDQSVEARVRIRSFGAGTDEKWVGLMANHTEPSNFLYMSLRSSNRLTLRRVDSGQVRQLGIVILPVSLNTWYKLRLESIGNRVRAYVNDKLLIEVTDQPARAGNAGLVTYKSAADFDDFKAVQP